MKKKQSTTYKTKLKKADNVIKESVQDYPVQQDNAPSALQYTSFEIANFRCLQKLTVEPLEQVNLIAGSNNVGKTTLLEAIFLHIGLTNPELALRIDRWRGFGSVSEMTEAPWRNLFWQFQDKLTIKLAGVNYKNNKRSLSISTRPSPSTLLEEIKVQAEHELFGDLGQDLIFNYKDESKKSRKVIATPYFVRKGDMVRFQLRTEPATVPPAFTGIFLNSRRPGLIEEEVQRFSDLRIKNQDRFIVDVIKMIEPRLEKIEILSPHGISMIYGYLNGYDEPVPLPLLGDGVRRVISLALSIGAARGGVVLIDEIENGIHHSVMESVWEAIAEAASIFNTQVFATTHSQECIRAAHDAFKGRARYDFRLHRMDRLNGINKIVTYDQESLEGALSIPLEVRG